MSSSDPRRPPLNVPSPNDARGAYEDYKKAIEIDPTFTLAADQLKRFTVTGQMMVPMRL